MSYRDTLHLPETSFPMKANLPEREPEWIAFWRERDPFRRMEAARRAQANDPARSFVLHDGPPYSNNNIHLGTAANKVWKDALNKVHLLDGKHVPFVPGWDNHGLPIENQVMAEFKKQGRPLERLAVRRACREYAARFVRIQMDEFLRLGVLGDWAHPYLTMDGAFEAEIVRTFGLLVEGGYVYRGLRSIHWCPTDRTALAEAEIEYQDDPGPSIHVAFPLWRGAWPDAPPPGADRAVTEALGRRFPGLQVVVWTTTPWTLPANLFVMAEPGLEYVALADGERTLLVAAARADAVREALGRALPERARLTGGELIGATFENPFGRPSPVLDGRPFVTAEDGTGFVHSAPGHGKEDFQIGQKYGYEALCPVDEGGVLTDEAAPFGGQHVFKVNHAIIAWLDERGRLLAQDRLTHAYPHCWRCRQPVIFRATDQWFMAIDAHGHRQRALEAIEATRWDPPASKNRIQASVETRPDWCLSRQRSWGVGIPALYCQACGEPTAHRDVVARVAERIAAANSDVWYEEPAEAFVPPGFHCPKCGAAGPWEKETDILDVWFDSGSTHRAVLLARGLRWPCDVYFEGPDQHRGWFNSSLMVAVATDAEHRAPYREVLTHGWVLDGEGRAMHKSLGNVIAPDKIIQQYGADILRLWACSTDWRTDVRASDEIVTRVVDAYRKVRNTLRFLIANLADAPPPAPGSSGRVADPARLEPLDRAALARVRDAFARAREDHLGARFHAATARLVELCTTDLSAFYLDFRKDALYTLAEDHPERRSAQAVLGETLRGLTLLLAPVLSFTAEEVWRHVPAREAGEASVFEAGWGDLPEPEPAALADWQALVALRDAAYRAIEVERAARRITKTNEATVALAPAGAAERDLLARYGTHLPTFLLVSVVSADGPPPAEGEAWGVRVGRTPYPRCERCWNHRATVGRNPGHPGLCDRCVAALPPDFVRPPA